MLTLKLFFLKQYQTPENFFKGSIRKQLIHQIFDSLVNELHVMEDSPESSIRQQIDITKT